MNIDFEIRKIALETLLEYEKNEVFSHVLLKKVLDKYDYLKDREKALISVIVKGVIERRIQLDYIIDQYSKTKTGKMKKPIRIILEMGTYQIVYMDTFDTLSVNSSVNLAKSKGFSSLAGFVNAILRNISKDKDRIKEELSKEEDKLDIKYSIPQFLTDLLLEQYDKDTVNLILESSLKKASVRLRIREDADGSRTKGILNELKEAGISLTPVEGVDKMYLADKLGNISELDAYNNGDITIQDTASYIFCKNVPYGDKILDACAAPGGKSMTISQIYPNAHITACDIYEDKLERMQDNFSRCNIKNVETALLDATEHITEYEEAYDVVVCDAPCSGLGVMGKKQDIKYNLTKEGIESIIKLQKKILDNLDTYVKKGGYLCYSTCTLNKDENIRQVDRFLKEHNYTLCTPTYIPERFKSCVTKDMVQFIQGEDTDGFFFSILKKNG